MDYSKYLPIGFLVMVVIGIVFLAKRSTSTETTNIQYSTITPSVDSSTVAAASAERLGGIQAATNSFAELVGLSQTEIASDTAITLGGFDRDARLEESRNLSATQQALANLQYQSNLAQYKTAYDIARQQQKTNRQKGWFDFFGNIAGSLLGAFF